MRHIAKPWLWAAILGVLGLVQNNVAGMLLGILAGAVFGAVIREIFERAGWVRPAPNPGTAISTAEFRRMVAELHISSTGAWGIPWSADRSRILEQVPSHLKQDFSKSRSPALMRSENAEVLGRRVAITVILKDDGYRELSLAPADPVVDPERSLYGLYGQPDLRRPSLPGESDAIWQQPGFAIDLNASPTGHVSLIVRSGTFLNRPSRRPPA